MTSDAAWQAEYAALSPEQQARVRAYMRRLQAPSTSPQPSISQGELYWAQIEKHPDQPSSVLHPQVVIQDDLFNQSRIDTVIVCALTSRLSRVSEPGNLLLAAGEGNLPKASVVLVSQLASIDRALLGEYIGKLSAERISQILDGIRFQQRAFYRR